MRKRRGSTPSPDTDTGNQSVRVHLRHTIYTGSSDHEAAAPESFIALLQTVNKLNIVHKLITIDSNAMDGEGLRKSSRRRRLLLLLLLPTQFFTFICCCSLTGTAVYLGG